MTSSSLSTSKDFNPVGIDLGSFHTRLAIVQNKVLSVIANPQSGLRHTLALSTIETEESYVFGDVAYRELSRKHSLEEISKNFSVRKLSNRNENDKNANSKIEEENKKCLSAFFEYLCEVACQAYGASCMPSSLRIVISVPSYFSGEEFENIISCCRKGVENLIGKIEGKKKKKKFIQNGSDRAIIGILSDSAAVCVAHGLTNVRKENVELSTNGNVTIKSWNNALVINWGNSGMLATTYVNIGGMLKKINEIHEKELSSPSIRSTLMQHVIENFARKYRIVSDIPTIRKNTKSMLKLNSAVENAIRTLNRGTTMVQIHIDSFWDGYDINVSLSRPRFDLLCNDFLKKLEKTLSNLILHEEIRKKDSQNGAFDVVLTAGSVSQMPAAIQIFDKMFQKSWRGNVGINVEESVAIGCARHATQAVGFMMSNNISDDEIDSTDYLSVVKNMPHMNLSFCPIFIGIAFYPHDDTCNDPNNLQSVNDIIPLVKVGTPLPLHVSKSISCKSCAQSNNNYVPCLIQKQCEQVITLVKINDISGIETLHLKLEIGTDRTISFVVNDSDTIILSNK